mmetsp:Transcript_18240/g.27835  ORF Transcript_18240/g.27835 Transcript_18240/m.27835 type:complete len:89 (+) Transcript_18240:1073-1339(+)
MAPSVKRRRGAMMDGIMTSNGTHRSPNVAALAEHTQLPAESGTDKLSPRSRTQSLGVTSRRSGDSGIFSPSARASSNTTPTRTGAISN